VRFPKISIVTPSFNQGRYIEQTIRSVVLQRYPALEYIMMDGGSTDETGAVLDRYAAYFAHVQSAPDRGQSDAIKRGFERSTGEIMAYLNSDDLLAPGTLFAVAAFFDRHPGVDVVYSHRCAIDADNTAIWYWILPPHSDALMKRWDLIPQETTFWRRSIYEKVGGIDSSFRFAMDFDLFSKFMQHGRLRRADRFFGAFRQHPESKTSRLMATIGTEEVERVWAEQGIRIGPSMRFVDELYSRAVNEASAVFAQRMQYRPGNLPGLGWNYDRLWGYQLARSEMPPAGRVAQIALP
jgi:glycosyltransferase involved in cell wall biosynthesis